MTNPHPNATAAGISGAATTVVISILDDAAHVKVDAELAAGLVTVVTGLVLFIGRAGLTGAWKRVWRGETPPTKGRSAR